MSDEVDKEKCPDVNVNIKQEPSTREAVVPTDLTQSIEKILSVEGLRKLTEDVHRWNRLFSALQYKLPHIDFVKEFRDIRKLQREIESYINRKAQIFNEVNDLTQTINRGDPNIFYGAKMYDTKGFEYNANFLLVWIEEIDDIIDSLHSRFIKFTYENRDKLGDLFLQESLEEMIPRPERD